MASPELSRAVRAAGFSGVRAARRALERLELPLDLYVERYAPAGAPYTAAELRETIGMDPERRANFLYLRNLAQQMAAQLEELEEEGQYPPDELFVELDSTLAEMDRILESYEEDDERVDEPPTIESELAYLWDVQRPEVMRVGCGGLYDDQNQYVRDLTWEECLESSVRAVLTGTGYFFGVDRERVRSASREQLFEMSADASAARRERLARIQAARAGGEGAVVPEDVRVRREIDRIMLLRLPDEALAELGAPGRPELLRATPRFTRNPSYAERAVFVWETTGSRVEVMRAVLAAGADPYLARRYAVQAELATT